MDVAGLLPVSRLRGFETHVLNSGTFFYRFGPERGVERGSSYRMSLGFQLRQQSLDKINIYFFVCFRHSIYNGFYYGVIRTHLYNKFNCVDAVIFVCIRIIETGVIARECKINQVHMTDILGYHNIGT